MICLRSFPLATLLAMALCLIGSVLFALLFDRAMEGFSMQVNTLVPVGSMGVRHVVMVMVGLVLFSTVCLFVPIGAVVTAVSVHGEQPRCQTISRVLFNCPSMVTMLCIWAYCLLLVWVVVLCFVAICSMLYFIFIASALSFCALVDQRCFDFGVLLPALIGRLTHKKFDFTFCQEKKEALCSTEHNMTATFIGAFAACFLCLIGLVHFLLCLIANRTRIRMSPRRKGDHYAINTNLSSDSFVLSKTKTDDCSS